MSKNNNMVSNSTENEIARIETELEVKTYLQNLKYALDNGADLVFQEDRRIDKQRQKEHTNAYTVDALFPDEIPEIALARELKTLVAEEYIRTVKDARFPKRSEMREFGRVYECNGTKDVYIKIRVELLAGVGRHTTFIMSFHFAIWPFSDEDFPYRRKEEKDVGE